MIKQLLLIIISSSCLITYGMYYPRNTYVYVPVVPVYSTITNQLFCLKQRVHIAHTYRVKTQNNELQPVSARQKEALPNEPIKKILPTESINKEEKNSATEEKKIDKIDLGKRLAETFFKYKPLIGQFPPSPY